MNSRSFALTAAIVFAVIALVQLARAVFGWEATVAGLPIYPWVSWLAFFVAAGLSYFGWKAYAGR